MAAELPVIWANYLSISGFLMLLVVLWMIPKKVIYTEAPDDARWRDIRWWGSGLILVQITLYIIF